MPLHFVNWPCDLELLLSLLFALAVETHWSRRSGVVLDGTPVARTLTWERVSH